MFTKCFKEKEFKKEFKKEVKPASWLEVKMEVKHSVHRRDDGIIYPIFRQPQYTRYYTFKDFCREAAEELLLVVSLLENEWVNHVRKILQLQFLQLKNGVHPFSKDIITN